MKNTPFFLYPPVPFFFFFLARGPRRQRLWWWRRGPRPCNSPYAEERGRERDLLHFFIFPTFERDENILFPSFHLPSLAFVPFQRDLSSLAHLFRGKNWTIGPSSPSSGTDTFSRRRRRKKGLFLCCQVFPTFWRWGVMLFFSAPLPTLLTASPSLPFTHTKS